MTEYRLTANDTIIRTKDQANIPPDPLNRDYAEYLEWLQKGGEPEAYTGPALVGYVPKEK